MPLFDAILSELEPVFGSATIQAHGIYRTANQRFEVDSFSAVLDRLQAILGHWSEGGETLHLPGRDGTINDSGNIQFELCAGHFFEYYHYETMTVVFIRLYHVKDRSNDKEWTALYLDENPQTPWWPDDERCAAPVAERETERPQSTDA